MFDRQGYLKMTDFGIARQWSQDNSSETSGTPGYMAPEVMCRQNHGVAVDFYALGVIAHECMLGRRPYNGSTRKEIRDSILEKQVVVKKEEAPSGWSEEAVDFVNQLIKRKPMKRLGANGADEVKQHPWFNGFDWDALADMTIKSPFVPKNAENFDATSCQAVWNDDNEAHIKHSHELLQRDSVQDLFTNYEYDEHKKLMQLKKELQK